MSRLRSIATVRRLSGLALTLAIGFCCEPAAGAADDSCELQLEVFINRAPTHLIGAFTVVGQRIAARRAELEEIGLQPRGNASPDEMIVLDELAGLTYRYEQTSQQIFITAADELRARKRLDASAPPQDEIAVRTDYGGVLNYNLFAASSRPWGAHSFAGSSVTLDARAFAPFGTLSQSGILRSSFDNRFDALRLDTTFAYSDRETLTTYRAGDTINGALAWTRPIRIGGVQMQRNFTLRPDLVLLPLPSAIGSAAVPSTIDVFVNNAKVSSQQIDSGPYQINNVPATSGGGTARVVLRDASGRETVTNLPFYVSPKLLAEGLYDYSVEAGMPRLSYGTSADTYAKSFVASASGRRGVADWLTLEGHAEAGAGLLNAGGGVVMRTGSLGVASAALSGSRYIGHFGLQSYLAYETSVFGMSMQVSSQRTFGSYDDLASATARLQASMLADTQSVLASLAYANSASPMPGALWTSARPPKALEHISLGLPLPFDVSTLSASFIHLNDASGRVSNILSASWSRAFGYNATAFVTAFKDISDRKNCGFMVGLSMPIGESALASAGVSRDSNGMHPTLDVVKPLGPQPGSVGWRVHDAEGNAPDRSASISYRSTYARIEAAGQQNGSNATATAQIDGAVVSMGNGVFFANRIDDAFAVVDAGVAGVEVFHENRPVGFTDANGRALIPSLRSYQKNKIAIDTRNLPVDADLASTQEIIPPADRSGVRVNFGVRTDTRAAILVLATPDGQPVPAGSQGRVEQTGGEGGETFVVGYDGRAWVKGLTPRNTVAVALAARECHATFDYSSQPNEQVVIPVTCQ